MSQRAATWSVRPPTPTVICARCQGHYVDDDEGRGAHVVVFGHQPSRQKIAEETA